MTIRGLGVRSVLDKNWYPVGSMWSSGFSDSYFPDDWHMYQKSIVKEMEGKKNELAEYTEGFSD